MTDTGERSREEVTSLPITPTCTPEQGVFGEVCVGLRLQ